MTTRDVAEILNAWDSFYVMIGGAAAALTGLMFVVITLVTDNKRAAREDGIATFSTPTVVHFGCALLISAVLSMPFRSFIPIEIIFALAGILGVGYTARIAHRTSRLETYEPDAEDWCCNVLLPFVAYGLLIIGALTIRMNPSLALYAPATAVTLVIFVGIHNAWDVVTYLATGKMAEDNAKANAIADNAEKSS